MNKHNNGCWYELLAQSTLQVVFPSEFCNIKLADRPDLVDDDLKAGIEVIHPTDKKHEMLNSYYYKNLHEKTINQISQMGLKKFQSHLYDIMLDPKNETISSYKKPYEPFDIEIIYRAIDKKINRLNSNLYSYADNISLYLEMAMYSVESANRSIAEKILAYAKESSKNKSLFFKEIFYDCMVCLYRINLQTETIAEIDIFNLIDSIELKYETNRTMLGDFYDQL